ncbi:helix-turn-helix domain-containing protein [Sphingomonas arantia]|uniref:Helix-turn-helix domain-containing protein n=1 Tax=Sphingomonas arantia TaxID=1460676 RepID=A0ABW4TYT1_9SPHN
MNQMRETRKALGITQAEMAAKLGLHQATISRFESGVMAIDERTRLALRAITPTPQQADVA